MIAIKTLNVSKFHHFQGENFSRLTGNAFKDVNEQYALAKLLCGKWDHARNGGVLKVEELTEEDKLLAVKEREATWQLLKAANGEHKINFGSGEDAKELTLSDSDLLVQFEALYTSKGKVSVPEYRAVYAFRRFSVLCLANALAKKTGKDVIESVPVEIVKFANKADRIQACVVENTHNNLGVHKLDWTDLYTAAYNLFVNGATQSRLRDIFKDGTGQKLWWVLQCNNRTKDCALLNELKAGSFTVSKTFMEVKKAFESLPAVKKGSDGLPEPLPLEVVKEALTSEATVKALSMQTVKNLATSSSVDLFKAVCTAIVNGDIEFFNRIHNDAEKIVSLNDAYRALFKK